MQTANIVIGILLIIMAVFLVISVLMQHGKDHRLSGSIAGGAETFFGKTKGRTMDAMLSKITSVVTVIFVLLVVILYVIQPNTLETVIPADDSQITDAANDTASDASDAQNTENTDAADDGAQADDSADANADADADTNANAEADADVNTDAAAE